MKSWIRSACLLAVACCAARAQTLSAILSGTVTDATGGVVPGAQVVVTNQATNVTAWRGQTDGAGLYLAPALPVGTYQVEASLTGFKAIRIRDIALQVDQRARVDVQLQPGAVTESVTVVGQGLGQLETETSGLGEVLDTGQVKNLPLPSRNVLNLLTLVAGVSAGGAATGINAAQLSINGSRTLNTDFTIDGISVVDATTGGPLRLPSTEAIREFKVLTSAYSAEYGRTSGGSVNVITESGTNEYHGGLYEFFRNEALNANNYFRNLRGERRAQDRYNQFGARFAGPVRLPRLYDGKDRTFFFLNYEGLRRRQPSTQISSLPAEAFRAGDFSASPVPVIDPTTGQQFAGNRIPVNRIDPVAARIMNLLPAPNSPGTADAANGRRLSNYIYDRATAPRQDEGSVRVDHSFSERARLFGRYTQYASALPTEVVIPGPLDNALGGNQTRGLQVSLGWTQTWTPTLLSELNVGLVRNRPERLPPTLGQDARDLYGLERAIGMASPRFQISGWRDLGTINNGYRREINNNYQASYALTWVRAAHTVKTGVQLRHHRFNIYNAGGPFSGNYTFNGEVTSPTRTAGNPVHALADFLLGQIQTVTYDLVQPPTSRRNHNIGAFVQDDWKVSRRLTLNLGLRYEYESPLTVANDIYSRVDIVTGRLLAAGKNASRSLNLDADRFNLAPRVGLAYSLNPKTVIRSAFGLFYSPFFQNLGGNVPFPGFTVRQNFQDLGVGVAQPFALRQGHPLTAVQNLADPFQLERQATAANPYSPSDQFGEINPLPSTLQWNFGVQREVLPATVLDVSYVASRGLHLPLRLTYNNVPYELGTEVARAGTALATQQARPFPQVTLINSIVHGGTSSYHSLQVKGTRQFGRDVSLLANYTWSKSIDDASGIFGNGLPSDLDSGQFPYLARHLDRGVSGLDRTHMLAVAMQATTRGPRWLRAIEINPILTARSGFPDTISQSNLHPSVVQQRPNVNGTNYGGFAERMTPEGTAIRYLLSPGDPAFPFTPTGPFFTGSGASRTLVLPFTGPGTLGRNTTRGPGELNLDVSVARRFPITERVRFTVRAEAFNALNRTNFNSPSTGLTVAADPRTGQAVWNSPGFGLITTAKSARFLQLVARLDF